MRVSVTTHRKVEIFIDDDDGQFYFRPSQLDVEDTKASTLNTARKAIDKVLVEAEPVFSTIRIAKLESWNGGVVKYATILGIRSDGNYTVLYDGDERLVNMSSQKYETREWTVVDGDVQKMLEEAHAVIKEKAEIESAASQEKRNAVDAFNAIGTKLVDYKH